ncbi:MAG: Choline-sulfatase [Verrucomicrobiota bacterium]|jgi:iduronate 2-sulfatase
MMIHALPCLRFLLGFSLLVAGIPLHAVQPPSPSGASSHPNVLLIIADDLNRELGCYGAKEARTPHLDRLAEEGVRFERAYGQGAVCTPSRKSFLTGLSTRTVGLHNFYHRENPDATSLGRHFRENGYQTIAIGKVEHTPEHQDPKAWDLRPEPRPVKARLKFKEEQSDTRSSKGARILTQVFQDGDLTTDATRTAQFAEFLDRQREPGKPFLAALGFHSPHEPHQVYQRHLDAHAVERMPLDQAPAKASPFNPLAFQFPCWMPEESVQRKNVQSYYAAVSAVDEEVGKAVALLEKYQLRENTIVIVIGDNGYHLGYRGQWAKHDVYPEVAQLPLIVCYPPLAGKGRVARGLVELVDLFPTLTELAGIPMPEKRDGRSFVPQLRDPGLPGKEAGYIEWILPRASVEENLKWLPEGGLSLPLPAEMKNSPVSAIYTEDWLYVEYRAMPVRELYRISGDPKAYVNVVEQFPELALALSTKLRAYFAGSVVK